MLDEAFKLKMGSLPSAPPPGHAMYDPRSDRSHDDSYMQPQYTGGLGARPSSYPGYEYQKGIPGELPGTSYADRVTPFSTGYNDRGTLRNPSTNPAYNHPAYNTTPASLYTHLSPRNVEPRGPYGLYGERSADYDDLSDRRRHRSRRHGSIHDDDLRNSVRRTDRIARSASSSHSRGKTEDLAILRQQNDSMHKQLLEQKRELEQALAAVGQPQTQIV